MDQDLIKRIVEAALLAAGQPLNVAQLSGLFPEEQPAPPGAIERALNALGEEAQRRGIELVEVASGFRFQVRQEVQGWVSRLWTERQTRYSRALLETLALIAYRQPITRGEIEQIRGVAVSSNIIRTLEEREWVRVVGHRDVPGKPALYGTTRSFLDYFGLKSLDQLPPLSELREIPDLEPQLQLEPVEGASGARDDDAAPAADGIHDTDPDTGPDGHAAGSEPEATDADEGHEPEREPDDDSDTHDHDGDRASAAPPHTDIADDGDSDSVSTASAADDGAGPDTSTEGPTETVRPEQTA